MVSQRYHQDKNWIGNRSFSAYSGASGIDFLQALSRLLSALAEFQPQAIVIALGLDAHKDDPLAGMTLETEDFYRIGQRGQTEKILQGIDQLLAKAGTDKSHILSATIWVTDMAEFQEMNAAWDAWVTPGRTPARACVTGNLAKPEWKVEIMVIAAIPA